MSDDFMTPAAGKQQVGHDDEPRLAQKPVVQEWPSQQLLGDSHEARILHGEEVYRLIRTRNDKLILVK